MKNLLALWKFLEGKKTYIAALGLAIYSVLGLVLHQHDMDTALHMLGEAAGLVGLRNAISNQ